MQGEPNAYFYLCKYHSFTDALPQPGPFCAKLAQLHRSRTSPDGKFGFHCTTFNGDMPQKNDWCDTWESFFACGLRYVLQVREERAGPNPTLDELLPALFHKVIPRLLQPMESNGRKLRPSLVHEDLWFGNTAVERCSGEVIVFDPAGFYGHNECTGTSQFP